MYSCLSSHVKYLCPSFLTTSWQLSTHWHTAYTNSCTSHHFFKFWKLIYFLISSPLKSTVYINDNTSMYRAEWIVLAWKFTTRMTSFLSGSALTCCLHPRPAEWISLLWCFQWWCQKWKKEFCWVNISSSLKRKLQ